MVNPGVMRNLHGQVMQELGRLIGGGEIAPGENLAREDLLAERMRVSRIALRKAMKVLSAKNLIEPRQKPARACATSPIGTGSTPTCWPDAAPPCPPAVSSRSWWRCAS